MRHHAVRDGHVAEGLSAVSGAFLLQVGDADGASRAVLTREQLEAHVGRCRALLYRTGPVPPSRDPFAAEMMRRGGRDWTYERVGEDDHRIMCGHEVVLFDPGEIAPITLMMLCSLRNLAVREAVASGAWERLELTGGYAWRMDVSSPPEEGKHGT